MSSTALRLAYTFDDYVRFERDAREKHEYVRGAILAMAGGTLEHAARCATVLRILGEQLRGRRCRAFDSNARVRVAASGNAYYPDASVVRGSIETDPTDALSLLNPSVVVEVLSPSTAEHDLGDKFADYQQIASLEYVVFVHHAAQRVELHTRSERGFSRQTFGPGETARLPNLGVALAVDELYFDPLAAPAG